MNIEYDNKNLKEYKRKKATLISELTSIKENINDDELNNVIDEKIKSLNEDRFVISIFGHYSNGKSTFLNALMGFGEEILVEDELASTAAITRLKYPKDLSKLNTADIKFSDGSIKTVKIEEIKNYSARNNENDVEHQIAEVILYLDSSLLKDGVEIVDTPGFNSTYQIHTDIAAGHVNKSDASIFLFSYDQPGSYEEFNFLKKISDKMDRVFLVINKIDKEDISEGTVEDTIDDIKHKMKKLGLNVDYKVIHKISALLERQGIHENSNEKREASKFSEFKNMLINYLTSDENVKDRLEAPVKSILSNLIECRNRKKDTLEYLSSENSDLKEEVAKRAEYIKEMENELKEKKKHIKRNVKKEIVACKNNMSDKMENFLDEITEEFSEVKSEFSLKTLKFEEITMDFSNAMGRCWKVSRNKLKDRLIEIIDESIDYEIEEDYIKEKLSQILDLTLNMNINNIDDPVINMDLISELDKKLEAKQKEYDIERKRFIDFKNDEFKKNIKEEQIIEIKKEIENLKSEKRDRLRSIGEGKVYRGKKRETYSKDREGIFGKIAQFFVGRKTEEEEIEYCDDSEVKLKDTQRRNVSEEYDKNIAEAEENAQRIQESIERIGNINYKLEESKTILELKRKEMFYSQRKIEEEKNNMETNLINISKRKYIRAIKDAGSEFEDDVLDHLSNNEKNIVKIIEEALVYDKKRIEKAKNDMFDLTSAQNMTQEEIDSEISKISQTIVVINEGIIKIKRLKDGEI